MIIYRIVKETREVGWTKRRESWTESEILSAYNDLSFFDPDTLFECSDKEQATAFFEEAKKSCRSWCEKSHIGLYVLFADVLTLEEIEEDEDGEFIQGNYIDQTAESFTVEEDEE